MHTLIYTQGGGRMGNQILTHIHLLATSIEYPEYDILNLSIIPYKTDLGRADLSLTDINDINSTGIYYRYIMDILWGENTITKILPNRILHRFRLQLLHYTAMYRTDSQSLIGGDPHVPFKLPGKQYSSINLTEIKQLYPLNDNKFSVIAGWNVRAWPLVKKYQDQIRAKMYPGKEYKQLINNWLIRLKNKHDILIGVHIRQTDYKRWKDGKYYFETETYNSIISEFSQKFQNKSIGFLISSDQDQTKYEFDEMVYDGTKSNEEHYMIDFIKLMHCDIILAPPSTFSTLAAFLADTPIVPLYEGVIADGFQYLDDPLFDSLDHPEMSEAIM